jgi:eukaryotic-like serine/threonine-protein kinase
VFNTSQDSYKAFRSIYSERTTQLLAWVGSGLSVPAGLPTWAGIQRMLESAISVKTETLADQDAKKIRGRLGEIRLVNNPWRRFSLLQDTLGTASFRDTVKQALSPALTAVPPAAYSLLWRLRIGGILNLNLDRLATRAYQIVNPSRAVHEFSGRDAGGYVHVLKTSTPFIVNLHGTAEDSGSWIWTKPQLDSLLTTPGYQTFVATCLASRVVLFLGITADDVAAGGHLERLIKEGIDPGTHYWITHRTDLLTDEWSEAAGIRVIRYNAPGNDHAELLEILEDLLGFVPPEDPAAPPVALQTDLSPNNAELLPTPELLAREDPERARILLNAKASETLGPRTSAAYLEYAHFCRVYDRAIHSAWYVTIDPPNNTLLTYQLIQEIGEGAFGRVFRALTPDGKAVAIKVLHEEVRRKQGMLESFRRGVQSMKILSERRVVGMVPYRDASEIPALAVMDFVEGYDLKEAVERRMFREWSDILRVSRELAAIIRAGHMLPERVLHRDIRPSNVMIKMIDYTAPEWEVVVLDFDLSWHRGALEKSVAGPSATYGYLAPEQLGLTNHSTRNAAVDAYGLGMTFRFVCTGRDPAPGEHLHPDWSGQLRREAVARRCAEWRSIPVRFARLIENSTRHEQHARWDVGQIVDELGRLQRALIAPDDVVSAELWAEELLAISGIGEGYEWDENELAAHRRLISGLAVRIAGNEIDGAVEVTLAWAGTGTEDRRSVSRWIDKAGDQAVAALRASGWQPEAPSVWSQSTTISAAVSVESVRRDSARIAGGLERAVQFLKFE